MPPTKKERISVNPVLKGAVRDAVGELAKKGGLRPTKRAPRWITMVIIAMELYPADRARRRFARWWAGFELFRIWAGLRLADHGGIPPGGLKRTARGLVAQLLESKTTGPGYRVEELPIWVSEAAYYAVEGWQEDFVEHGRLYTS